MDRQSSEPGRDRSKAAVAARIRLIRSEIYGKEGALVLAGLLGLPDRSWLNYEGGVTIPGEILLHFLELTSVEPLWLLRGAGARFREMSPEAAADAGLTD